MPSLLFEALKESSSPYINHFLQPDSIIPRAANPQSWNRYSYVANNPLRYTDPMGHRYVEGEFSGNKLETVEEKMSAKWRDANKKRVFEAELRALKPSGPACSGSKQSPLCLSGGASELEIAILPTTNFGPDFKYTDWPPKGYYIAGYETYLNWHKVNKTDLTIDVAGLIADAGYLTWGSPAAPVTVPVTLIAQGIEWIGIGDAVLNAYNNDFSDLSSFGLEKIVEFAVETRAPKAVPLVGVTFTIASLVDNGVNALDKRPILKPIPSWRN